MDATAHSHDPTPPHPLGLIGSEPEALAIARRLADTGHRILHSILPPAAALPRAANLEPADAPFDIAAACKVIALCIDDTERLRRLLFGDKDHTGLAADVAAGSVFIDFGIRPPREAQSMIGLLGMRGIGLVDCALLGSHAAIASGTASVLAGGFPDAVDSVLPLLTELGHVERTGPLGSAQTAAALMGYVEAAHVAARADAMSVGKALGLKPHALAHILEDTGADKIIRLERRAEVARVIAKERGLSADVIAFKPLARIAAENG